MSILKTIETTPTSDTHVERVDILELIPECAPDDSYLRYVIEGIKRLVAIEHEISDIWSTRKLNR